MAGASALPLRRTLLGISLLAAVIAAGFLGMLLSRHFHHDGAPVQTPFGVAAAAPLAAGEAASRSFTKAGSGLARPGPNVFPGAAAAAQQSSGSPGAIAEEKVIGLALRRWQTALLSNDPAQIAPSYAKVVDRYFLRTGVSREFVRDYMQTEEARGVTLMTYDLRNVSIEPVSKDEADVHFVADFSVNTPSGVRLGSAHTMLKLHQEQGDWKIFYERDFRS